MKIREITVNLSHEHIVQAIASYLSNTVLCPWDDNEVVLDADLGITLNEEGYVPVILTLEELEEEEDVFLDPKHREYLLKGLKETEVVTK